MSVEPILFNDAARIVASGEDERCPYMLAGYEEHAGHQCIFAVFDMIVAYTSPPNQQPMIEHGHPGRHQCEHGKDGGWRKMGLHTP